MSFPRYPKYKDSGVEWLGQVPDHWDVVKGRRLFTQERDPSQPTDQQLSATQKYGVVPQKLFMEMEDQKVTLALSGLENFKQVQEGDFVISLRSFQGGIERSAYSGCVSPAYTVLRPSDSIHGLFWGYLLKSKGYIEALQTMTDGIRDGKNISYHQFGNIGVPVVPVAEQTRIAAFLDQETAKIDALVAEQERLMALLMEKRQAVISHAVTKGLNPQAAMKPSGIEWLGDVPAHWVVAKTSRYFKIAMGQTILKDDLIDDGEWPVFSATDGDHYFGRVNHPQVRLQVGDIVIPARGNSIGSVKLVKEPATTTQTTIYCKNLSAGKLAARFAYQFFLGCKENLFYFTQTAIPQITVEEVSSNPIVLPPPIEQTEIADYLEAESAKLDTLTAEAQRAINLLQERRTALISAAVTGQIDVRTN